MPWQLSVSPGQYSSFFMMISFAINQGSVAIIARYVGSAKYDRWVSRAVRTGDNAEFSVCPDRCCHHLCILLLQLFSLMGVAPEVKNDGVSFPENPDPDLYS
jgi:hypothetical protein